MSESTARANRRGLFFIGAALLFVFGIAIIVTLVMELALDDPETDAPFEPEQNAPAQPGCWFETDAASFTVYDSADTDAGSQELSGELQYPLRSTDGDFFELELRDGQQVFVPMNTGRMTGECEEFDLEP